MVPIMTPPNFATADLFDEHGDRLQVCEPVFRDFGGVTHFCGPIKTLKAFEAFLLTKETLATDGEGHVLVIDGGASLRCAMLGDKLAQLALDNGWAGVLINGCIRDSAAIEKLALGVKAIATNPTRPEKIKSGELDVPLHFAGVDFHPGHFLYADKDGVVVSQHDLLNP